MHKLYSQNFPTYRWRSSRKKKNKICFEIKSQNSVKDRLRSLKTPGKYYANLYVKEPHTDGTLQHKNGVYFLRK